MAEMPAGSVDSIVTDPPYGLSFMGKGWDHGVPGVEFWQAALRVAKPGAHLLAFGGTRTFHRLTVAIEDAGWEVRDCLMWVYGSGFPKSHDVSKAIDKAGGDALAWRAFSEAYSAAVAASSMTHSDIDRVLGIKSSSCYWARTDHRGGMPPRHHWERVRELLALPSDFAELYDEAEREIVGQRQAQSFAEDRPVAIAAQNKTATTRRIIDITAPATDAARQWSGWGTALKPSYEPIILARKPLSGTVAANVLEHGTGALNVDGCRVEDKRWPANLIHDGSDEVVGLMAEAARFFYCAKASKRDRDEGCEGLEERHVGHYAQDEWSRHNMGNTPDAERKPVRNHHPTVKPTDLMRYLCRLVTPPGGLVLDPFGGSGSTGKAALLEGFRVTLCELSAEYWPIIEARCKWAANERPEGKVLAMVQRTLFSGD